MILPKEEKTKSVAPEYRDALYQRIFSVARHAGTDAAMDEVTQEVLKSREGMNRTLDSARILAASLEVRAEICKIAGNVKLCHEDLFEARGLMGSADNEDKEIGRLDAKLGDSYEALGNNDAAIAFYTLAAQRFEKNRPPVLEEAALMRNNLAMLCKDGGQFDEAVKHFLEAINLCKSAYGSNHVLYADLCFNLACLYEGEENYEAALEWHLEAYNTRLLLLNAQNQEIGLSAAALAICYAQLGNNEDANEYFERAEPILRRYIRQTPDLYCTMAYNYSAFLRNMGRISEAEAMEQLIADCEESI